MQFAILAYLFLVRTDKDREHLLGEIEDKLRMRVAMQNGFIASFSISFVRQMRSSLYVRRRGN